MKESGLALLATENLEKNAEGLRKKIIISVDINNVKC